MCLASYSFNDLFSLSKQPQVEAMAAILNIFLLFAIRMLPAILLSLELILNRFRCQAIIMTNSPQPQLVFVAYYQVAVFLWELHLDGLSRVVIDSSCQIQAWYGMRMHCFSFRDNPRRLIAICLELFLPSGLESDVFSPVIRRALLKASGPALLLLSEGVARQFRSV